MIVLFVHASVFILQYSAFVEVLEIHEKKDEAILGVSKQLQELVSTFKVSIQVHITMIT